jgi:hypothetical protein
VPWINGVKWREANGLKRLKPKDKRVGFNGAAMAGPLNQNPKRRRLIQVQLRLGLMLLLLSLGLFWQNG